MSRLSSCRVGLDMLLLGCLGVVTFAACGETDSAPGVSGTRGGSGTQAPTSGGAAAIGGANATGGSPGNGGALATGGAIGNGGAGTNTTGGAKATGGASGTGGAKATGGAATSTTCTPWPAAASTTALTATRSVSGSFDGGMVRFTGWGGTQDEDQEPLFELANGATLQNVIIGTPAGDGIHCLGTCTLKNVWWEDVGEDAATLKGTNSVQVMTVDCAGAKNASDKIFQHNGPGTMIIKNFWAQTYGKVYRSCGNCTDQYERHAIFSNVTATGGGAIAGINTNYKDTAKFWSITTSATLCERYTGNDTGAEPTKTGTGIDGTYCINLTAAP